MTHYNAETLELVSDDELSERYDSFLDDSGEYSICIEGIEFSPSEVLKTVDPSGYDECRYNYINTLYDAGELMSEWDRAEHIEELVKEWAYNVLGAVMDLTTIGEDEIIYNALFKLFGRGVLELDAGEIQLSLQHTMAEVLISLGAALKENKYS